MSGERPRLQPAPARKDPVIRLAEFRAAHPDVAILQPAGHWRAVIPAGTAVHDDPMGALVSGLNLEGLMDELDKIYPPGAEAGREEGTRR